MAERYRLIYVRREEIPISKITTIRQALKFLNKSNKLTVGEAGPTRKSKKGADELTLEAAEAAAEKKALLSSIGITEATAPEPEAVPEPYSTIESAPTNESAPTPENFEKVWKEIDGWIQELSPLTLPALGWADETRKELLGRIVADVRDLLNLTDED